MLRRNERGIAVPDKMFPLPWTGEGEIIRDCKGKPGGDCINKQRADFVRHAANYHERLAEIALRLAEANEAAKSGKITPIWLIVEDAAALWDEMKEDAGDGSSES